MFTKVCWVSRHEPLPIQIKTLREKLGDVEVVIVSRTFRDADEVYDEVKRCGCKYAVLVLPLSMIAILVKKKDVVWLWAEMEPVHEESCELKEKCPEYNRETDVLLESRGLIRHLRFEKFKRIVDVSLVFEEF